MMETGMVNEMERGRHGHGNLSEESENVDPERPVVTQTAVLRKTRGHLFKCKQCPLTYFERNLLLKHLADSHNRNIFQCSNCPDLYTNPSNVLRHMRIAHPDDKSLLLRKRSTQCTHCHLNFPTYSQLLIHKNSIHNPRHFKFKCDVCTKEFTNFYNMLRHRKLHDTADNPVNVTDRITLDRHRKLVNRQNKISDKAAEKTEDKEGDQHDKRPEEIDNIEKTGEIGKTVEIIDKSTDMEKIEMTNGNPPEESENQIVVTQKPYFKKSETAYENSEEKPEDDHDKLLEETENISNSGKIDKAEEISDKSSVVTKQFGKEGATGNGSPSEKIGNVDLKPVFTKPVVIRQTKRQSFKCMECPTTEPNRNLLLKHLADCHNTKVYKCPGCANLYKKISSMMRHIKQQHPDDQRCLKLKKKNPKCTDCDLEFPSYSLMWLHKSKDHKAKLFKCEICGNKFKNKFCLGRHLKKSHGSIDMPVNKKKTQVNVSNGTPKEEEEQSKSEQYPVLVDAADTAGFSIPQQMLETLNQLKNQANLKIEQDSDSSFFLHLGRYDPSSI